VVVGNPGRQTGWVSEYGHKLVFGDNGIAICPESGQTYRLSEEKVTRIN
jgi:UDP-2-acetamido-3-amino-2,3-dideoxy-glucuronate N-acetyltransferase